MPVLEIVADSRVKPRKAGVLQLVFLTYALICGGAYGLEEMISTSGPGLAITVLAIFPLLYAAPMALVCSELASRYPVRGGYYRWTSMAFGRFAGFNVAWLMWIALFATNASFAVLFGNYLRYFFPNLSPEAQFAVSVALVWVAVLLNGRGIHMVGTVSTVLMLAVLTPFVVMTITGFLRWQHNPMIPFVHPGHAVESSLANALMMAIWLYGGFEKVTVLAGEVEQPRRSFRVALGFGLLLCIASYVLPTVAALAALGNWQTWGESHFSLVGLQLGGSWLGAAIAAGGLISNAGIITATILSQSRLPLVLAEDGLFPDIFSRTEAALGTPTWSLLASGVILTGFCAMRFLELTNIYAIVQSVAYLAIYAAFVKLQPGSVGHQRTRWLLLGPGVAAAVLVLQQKLFAGGYWNARVSLLLAVLFGSGPLLYWWISTAARGLVSTNAAIERKIVKNH
jgi:amino acid transporter